MTQAHGSTQDDVISTLSSSSPASWNWTAVADVDAVTVTDETNLLSNSTSFNGSSNCFVLRVRPDFLPWANPDNLVSAETEEIVRRVRDLAVLPVLFLIGCPANVINMAVFYKQGLKERVNVCLFAMSLADGLFLLYNMLLYGEQLRLQLTSGEQFGPFTRFLINNHFMGFYGVTSVSQILSAIIASERCFCILQPFRSKTVLRTSTMTAIVVTVYVGVIAPYFLIMTKYRVACVYDVFSGKETWTVVPGQFYLKNKKLIDILNAVVFGAGLNCGTVAVVTTTTILTMVKLRQAAAWRAGASSSGSVSPQEVALTRMLVYSSCFFVLCVSPVALFRFTWLFVPDINPGGRYHNLALTCFSLIDMLLFTNASCNILVYYSMGSRYRLVFWALFGRTRIKSNSVDMSGVTSCTNE